MHTSWHRQILMAVTALAVWPWCALAQQTFPRPIVLYRPPAGAAPVRGPVTFTAANNPSQVGNVQNQAIAASLPNGFNNQNPSGALQTAAGSANGWNSAPPGSQPTSGIQQFNQAMPANTPVQTGNTNSPSQTNNTDNQWATQQTQPSHLALLNPSGMYNINQTGMTTAQHYAPNLYFGQQFQTWTNQQSMTDSPASYGEMSRFQTGQFGGYVAPNTYLGSGFSSWSNLSSGSISPGANGGWSYSTWP